MSQYKIAPSILAADYANFEREIKRLEATGAEYAHIDIMDGHFVPQISFGAGVVESLRPHSKMVFDCHLMVSNPEHHLEDFARAGADIISIHVEATPHIHGALFNCWLDSTGRLMGMGTSTELAVSTDSGKLWKSLIEVFSH